MLTSLPADFHPEVTNRAFIETAFERGQKDGLGTVNANPFVSDSPVHEAYELGFADGQAHGAPEQKPVDWTGVRAISERAAESLEIARRFQLAEAAPNMLAALRAVEALLADWPTMRALSAVGAEHATANKLAAREVVAAAIAQAEGR